MLIYISCDSRNHFFINTVKSVVGEIQEKSIADSIELVFPPLKLGGDTGKIRSNVLRIRNADLVLFDVTPSVSKSRKILSYNPGVMIEYGIVMLLESQNPPWESHVPLPIYRVFCESNFDRGTLTPILNADSISKYNKHQRGKDSLKQNIRDLISERIGSRLRINYTQSPANLPPPIG